MPKYSGEQILAERERRRMSRREMAEATGLTQGIIGNIEKGSPIKLKYMDAIDAFMSGADVALTAPPTVTEPAAASPPAPDPFPPGDIVFLADSDDDDDESLLVDFIKGEVDNGFTPVPPSSLSAPEPHFTEPQATTPPPVIETPVTVGRLISNSEVQTYKRCKRKWWLAWYRHLKMKSESPTGARAIGTWVHKALQMWYVPDGEVRTDPREALERVLLEINTIVTQHATALATNADDGGFAAETIVQAFRKDADLSRAMVDGYVEWLQSTGSDSTYHVIAPEQKITAPIPFEVAYPEPVQIVGKLDVRLLRTSDNVRLFMDHKTVASIDRATKMLYMNEQMLHYLLLEHLQYLSNPVGAEDSFVDGALYNMLRKVKRTGNAKPPFYQRVEVRHNNHEIHSYVQHLTGTVREMLATETQLNNSIGEHQVLAPPSPRDDCTWSCDFYSVCPLFDDGSRAEDFVSQYFEEVGHLDYYEDSLLDATTTTETQ